MEGHTMVISDPTRDVVFAVRRMFNVQQIVSLLLLFRVKIFPLAAYKGLPLLGKF